MSLVWIRHETWKGWYQCDMVTIWDGVPYFGFENKELVWLGWEYEGDESWETVWDVCIYLCVCMLNLFGWLRKFGPCQCVIPWDSLGGIPRVVL